MLTLSPLPTKVSTICRRQQPYLAGSLWNIENLNLHNIRMGFKCRTRHDGAIMTVDLFLLNESFIDVDFAHRKVSMLGVSIGHGHLGAESEMSTDPRD